MVGVEYLVIISRLSNPVLCIDMEKTDWASRKADLERLIKKNSRPQQIAEKAKNELDRLHDEGYLPDKVKKKIEGEITRCLLLFSLDMR